jgi:hypothetical protein
VEDRGAFGNVLGGGWRDGMEGGWKSSGVDDCGDGVGGAVMQDLCNEKANRRIWSSYSSDDRGVGHMSFRRRRASSQMSAISAMCYFYSQFSNDGNPLVGGRGGRRHMRVR